ncbi:MAG: MFS transporter [Chloroflexota bacterium]
MTEHPKSKTSLTNITILMVFTRLIEATVVQLFFPFLPIIAAGINVSEIQMGRLLGIQSSTALIAPFFGTTADKRGYRRLIQLSLTLTVSGNIIIYFSDSLPIFTFGLFLQGIGLSGSNPLLVAYLSHLLPFERRSRGLSYLEYAWALAGLVMLPLFGWLIDATSWRVPFLILGILQATTIFAFGYLPSIRDKIETTTEQTKSLTARLREFVDLGENRNSALAVLATDSLVKFSGLSISYTFGIWLIDTYNLQASGLGQTALLLGGADICGSLLVGLTGDRLGKRRSVLIGTTFAIIFYAVLPLWNWSLPATLFGLFLSRWAFEYTFVSVLVFTSEQIPDQRGKLLSLRVGFGFVATILATFIAPALYAQFGMGGVAIPGTLGMVCAWAVTWFFTIERG